MSDVHCDGVTHLLVAVTVCLSRGPVIRESLQPLALHGSEPANMREDNDCCSRVTRVKAVQCGCHPPSDPCLVVLAGLRSLRFHVPQLRRTSHDHELSFSDILGADSLVIPRTEGTDKATRTSDPPPEISAIGTQSAYAFAVVTESARSESESSPINA